MNGEIKQGYVTKAGKVHAVVEWPTFTPEECGGNVQAATLANRMLETDAKNWVRAGEANLTKIQRYTPGAGRASAGDGLALLAKLTAGE